MGLMFESHEEDDNQDTPLGDTWSSIFGPYVELARTALHGLRSMPLQEFGHHDQLSFLSNVAPLRSELESLLAESLLVVERSGASVAEHGLNAPNWMSNCTGDSKSASRRTLLLGRTRRFFPLFAQAVEDGRISIDHLHVLGSAMNPRVREIMQNIEEDLLKVAETHTVEQWRKELRAMIDYADMDGNEPEQPIRDDEATMILDESGRLSLRGEFYGASAVTIYDLINAEVQRQLKAAKRETQELDLERPSPKALRGRALAEVLLRGGQIGKQTRGHTEAVLILDPRSELHPIRTTDGHDVDPVTATMLLCDADVSSLHLNEHGHPLNYGRTLRFASPEQRWALAVRDGGCVFPGCDKPASWCQAHHVITWERDNGQTDIDNMVLLCQRHHTFVHSNEWDLVPNHLLHDHDDPRHGHDDQGLDHNDCCGGKQRASCTNRNSDSTADSYSCANAAFTLIHRSSQRRRRIMSAQTRHRRRSTQHRGRSNSSSDGDDGDSDAQ